MIRFALWTMADLIRARSVHDRWRASPMAPVEGFEAHAAAVRAEIIRRTWG